jgi:DNA-binding MarR family transcriptional regulator
VATVRLTERAQRALWLVAEHGVLGARQVGVLLGVSRPTAHRLLRELAAAGLLERPKPVRGSEHRRLYRVSWSGGRVVTEAQRRAGLPVFGSLFARPGSPDRQHRVNDFFVALVEHAAGSDGRSGLLGWRHGFDAEAWLAERGVARPDCDGSGIWLEDGRVVRFVVVWDRWESNPMIAGLAGGGLLPVDVVLAVADRLGEPAVLEYTAGCGLAGVVASTTPAILAEVGPAGPAWATTAELDGRRRLGHLTEGAAG